jgi:hypothetical protein
MLVRHLAILVRGRSPAAVLLLWGEILLPLPTLPVLIPLPRL